VSQLRRAPRPVLLAGGLALAGLAAGGGLAATAAVPACDAPECLVALGPPSPAAPGPALIAAAHREPGVVALVLARPALVSATTARGRVVDRWLAPAGLSRHALRGRGALRLRAVDGAGVAGGQLARAAASAALRVENTWQESSSPSRSFQTQTTSVSNGSPRNRPRTRPNTTTDPATAR